MTAPGPERLFQAMDATWPPARFLKSGPWLLREGKGGGQRVSSASSEAAPCETDIELAEEGMRDLGQRPIFMIRDKDGPLDGWLAARGYEVVDPVTLYLAPVQQLARDLPLTAAIPSWPPLAIQADIWSAGGVGPARLDVMARARHGTSIMGRTGDVPAGTAFVAVDGEIGMLHALEIDPSARRKGVGRTVMAAAANWLSARGAAWIAVAVTQANMAGNALYGRIGMKPATAYHYRRAPECVR